jgi:hypothetical protein
MAITTQGASYPLESFGPNPALPQGTGGYQLGAGNLNEPNMVAVAAPATATASATLTANQVLNGILLGSPGGSAASYQLPTVATLEAAISSAAAVGESFDFSVMNVDGTGSGVITLTTNTGWTLVGLMTVVATAGTAQMFRARKTGSATWALYRIA